MTFISHEPGGSGCVDTVKRGIILVAYSRSES
jgi:hypothetical protein